MPKRKKGPITRRRRKVRPHLDDDIVGEMEDDTSSDTNSSATNISNYSEENSTVLKQSDGKSKVKFSFRTKTHFTILQTHPHRTIVQSRRPAPLLMIYVRRKMHFIDGVCCLQVQAPTKWTPLSMNFRI